MWYFLVLTLVIFALYLSGFNRKPGPFQWMDREYTSAIKGFSILTVVWVHSGAALSIGGIQWIGGIGIALFLICSGYGLDISYKKSGLHKFWMKRLFGVFLPFWFVELIGLLGTGAFTFKTYFLDVTFLRPATSYGWFMGYILICYLIFYLVWQFVPAKRRLVTLFSVFGIWFILESVFFANSDMPFLRARQMFSFPCGVFLAMHKGKIEAVLTKKIAF